MDIPICYDGKPKFVVAKNLVGRPRIEDRRGGNLPTQLVDFCHIETPLLLLDLSSNG